MNMDLNYCKIFFDSNLDYDSLLKLITDRFDGIHTGFSSIHFDWGECCFKKNDYFTPVDHDAAPDDFIYWRYYLEFYDDNNDFEAFSSGLRDISLNMKAMGIRNIASCDFEDLFEK